MGGKISQQECLCRMTALVRPSGIFDRGKIFTVLDRWRIVREGSSGGDGKGVKNVKIILLSREAP